MLGARNGSEPRRSCVQGSDPAGTDRLHRSGAPFRDLEELGGWKSAKTLTDVCLLPDEEAERRALDGAESARR